MGAEPLSDGERAVVAAAEAEARKLHHDRLGTEHLLLGVLSYPDEPGARALAKLGVTLGPTRASSGSDSRSRPAPASRATPRPSPSTPIS